MPLPSSPSQGASGRVLSWGVHLLTASGAVLGVFALVCIADGRLGQAALMMLGALVIDAVDGTLARAARVSEFVPQIDGRRLDDIVDFLNFVIVPMLFLWSAGNVSHPGWLAAPVTASAVGFARVDAKTKDDFFLGFPSYWNILALYFWVLEIDPVVGTSVLVALSLAVFAPLKFLYPSKVDPMGLRVALGLGGVLWTAALVFCVVDPEAASATHLHELSLAYPAWYLYLSFKRGDWSRALSR